MTQADLGWPATVVATGVGSLPGTDPAEAVRVVLGELPDLPFLPELPGRGPHADLGGRGAVLLAGLAVDLQPSGWRLVTRPGRDHRLARDLLSRDLDALEEATQGGPPSVLKVQCAGPWTLSSLLRLPRGERALADHGAVDDLAASLADGLREHLSDLRRRLPGTVLLLQLDEPSLPAAMAGRIPTSSGWGTLRSPDVQRAAAVLSTVLIGCGQEPARTVVHCCAPEPPIDLLLRAGAGAVSLDATLLTPREDETLGQAVEAGRRLLLGVVPTVGRAEVAPATAAVTTLWGRLGFDADQLQRSVVLTPTCGLASASPDQARRAMAVTRECARRLTEAPET